MSLYLLWMFTFAIECQTVNVLLNDHDLNFQDQTFRLAILTGIGWKNANITIANGLEVMYLPSNCFTANIVRRDFDVHFQGYEV